MSNREIISTEAMLKGFEYDGNNLYTFQEWKKRGYSVKKGQKAFIKTSLWKSVTKENKETGKKETKMFLTVASLFNINQVELIKA